VIERIGPYRIERVLGAGAMGVVYKGRHDVLGREAAIKAALPRHGGDEQLHKRLLGEARAQAHLSHPNIVAVFEPIEGEDGQLFIAMEYVEGETLRELLQRSPGTRLTVEAAKPIFEQLLDALHYVHTREIVHRDLKPSNVMISNAGRVKLTDFGLALLAGEPRLTTHGVAGTPEYMSPEQLEGRRDLDGRSDIYSAALVFYRMLAGCSAFERQEYLPMVHARLTGPRPISTVAPHLPTGLCEALAKATQYERDNRFRSAADFRNALCDGAVGYIGPAAPPGDDESTLELPKDEPLEVLPPPVSGHPSRKAAAIVCAALAAGGAYVGFGFTRQPAEETPAITANTSIQGHIPVEPHPGGGAATPPPQPPHEEPPQKESPQKEPPKEPPNLPITPVVTTTTAVPDEHADDEDTHDDGRAAEIERLRRRAIDVLALQLDERFRLAREQLDTERFDEAREELKSMVALAGLYPDDLGQQLQLIEQLQTEEPFMRRLATVEKKLREKAWIEADYLARDLALDRDVPPGVAERAREIRQKVKELRDKGFTGMQTGPTTNDIVRKPSSPPRKHL
jgi:serine/threonine-protein kinase